jgi:hypothetical protein
VSPDITIKISLDPDGTATSHVVASGPPSPMALDALLAQAPAASGEGPAPMAIEQLGDAESAQAPHPQDLGMLETVGGPPAPQSLEQLGAVDTRAAPEPLDLNELEAARPREHDLAAQSGPTTHES